jgi:hypothetical protein
VAEDFELLVPGRSPEQVAAAARAGGDPFYRAGLHVRVRGARIRARYTTGGKYDLPPVLRGRLEEDPRGTVVVGRLRWWSSNVFTGVFWFAALLMAATAVLVGRTGGGGGAVAFCAGSAFLMALIAVFLMIGGALAGNRDRDRLSAALLRALQD